MKRTIRSVLRAVSSAENFALLVTGSVLVVVVAMGVFFRYVLKEQLSWAYELSILLFIWATFLGVSAGTKSHAHITFDFLARVFPESWYHWICLLGNTLVVVIAGSGVWLGYTIFQRTLPQQFQTIPISRGWMYLALPVGFLLMIIHMVENTVDLLSEIRSDAQTNGGNGGAR